MRDQPDDFKDLRLREKELLYPILLKGKVKNPKSRVHYVSSKEALAAIKKQDREQLELSNFPEFQNALTTFLIKERGIIKLGNDSRLLHEILTDILTEIKTELQNLHTNKEEVSRRLEEANKRLEIVYVKRTEMIDIIDKSAKKATRRTSASLNKLLSTLMDTVEKELYKYEPNVNFVIKTNDYMTQCVEFIHQRIKYHFKNWQDNELETILDSVATMLVNDLSELAAQFSSTLDSVRLELLGDNVTIKNSLNSDDGISALNRILSAAGGFLFGGIGAAVVGGALGYKEMIKTAGLHFGVIIGFLVCNVTNPIVIIPVLLALGILQVAVGKEGLKKKVKDKILKEVNSSLMNETPGINEKFSGKIESLFSELQVQLKSALDVQISSVKEEIDRIRSNLNISDIAQDERIRLLSEIEILIPDKLKEIVAYQNFIYNEI